MLIHRDMDARELSKKIVLDYQALQSQIFACRILGARIVLTIGSWDMLHIGHARYLIKARSHGDILIVGVDSDRAIKSYKGLHRPMIVEEERREMLAYQAYVDFVTTVDDVDSEGKWQYGLLRLIKPDVFVAVEDSYPGDQREELRRHSGEVVVLPRQAENTSSTDIFKKVVKDPEVARFLREIEVKA